MRKTKVLVSVVVFNNLRQLKGLLDDITVACHDLEDTVIDFHVRFFDNASTDNSPAFISDAGFGEFLYCSKTNVGFGKGHNWNIFHESSDLAFVVNPDVRFESDAVKEAVALFSRSPKLGLLVPKLVFPDGSPQHLCKRDPRIFDIFLRRFAPVPVQRMFAARMARFAMEDFDYEGEFPIEYGSGAFMMFRTDVYRRIGGFDPRYFMYIEDADITREVRSAGYEALYSPAVEAVHAWEKGSYHSVRLALINVASVLKYSWKWDIERKIWKKGGTVRR